MRHFRKGLSFSWNHQKNNESIKGTSSHHATTCLLLLVFSTFKTLVFVGTLSRKVAKLSVT